MLSPTDAAWSVLEEGHRVEKALPLLIPAAMAAYGGYQAAQNVKRNEITEPFIGTTIAEGNDSPGSTALQIGSGLAEGFVPVKGLGALRGVAGKKLAGRRAAKFAAAEKEAAEAAARHQAMSAQQSRALAQTRNPEIGYVFGPSTPTLPPSQVGAARQMANATQARAARLAPRAPPAPAAPLTMGQKAKRLGVMGGAAAVGAAPALAGGALMASAQSAPTVGFNAGASDMGAAQGGQQGFQLAGQPSGGIGGVGNVNPGQATRHDIWSNVQWSGQNTPAPIQQNWPQQTNTQAPSTVRTGMPMSLGNHLLKSALGNMEYNIMKANPCPKCGKKGCVSKMGCVAKAKCPHCDGDGPRSACICGKKEKAEGKKKPAHGMVIVIGSKAAGPGPSTDGKRDDKKDEKE